MMTKNNLLETVTTRLMCTTLKSFTQVFLATVIALSLTFTSALGQAEYLHEQNRNYVTWVKPTFENTKIKGYLYDIGENYLVISHPGKYSQKQDNYKIHFNNIENIQFRKEGNIALGLVIGGILGAVVGGIIDNKSNQSSSSSIKSSNNSNQSSNNSYQSYHGLDTGGFGFDLGPIATIFGASAGAIIGGIVGSFKISKPINGNPQYQKEKLIKYKLIN